MKCILSAVSCVFILASCKERPRFSGSDTVIKRGADDHLGDTKGPGGTTDDTENPRNGTTLELVPDYGSKLRFMNGRALTVVYGRVFKEDANGFAHCAKDKPTEHTGCSLMFNTEERASMGMFDLYSERMRRGIQNVAPAENLTLNYMRNLRAALGRECVRLVEKEEAAPAPTNLLVRDAAPTAEVLEAFVRKILDAPSKSVELDIPFADYVKAWQTASTMGDAAKAKRNAYINLCVSLAMDPQIFMY